METNVGMVDGAFRMVSGALLLLWSYGELGSSPPDTVNWLIWAIGLGLALTGLFHHCPIFAFFNVNSCANTQDPGEH